MMAEARRATVDDCSAGSSLVQVFQNIRQAGCRLGQQVFVNAVAMGIDGNGEWSEAWSNSDHWRMSMHVPMVRVIQTLVCGPLTTVHCTFAD